MNLWNELIDEMPKEWNISRATLKQGQTIKEIAQNIVEHAPQSFVLIGFSLGGYIARSIVEQFPEKVKALILIASSLRSDTEEQKSQKLTAIKLNSGKNFHGLSSISIENTSSVKCAESYSCKKNPRDGQDSRVMKSSLNNLC